MPKEADLQQRIDSFKPCIECGRLVRHSEFNGLPWSHYGCALNTITGLSNLA